MAPRRNSSPVDPPASRRTLTKTPLAAHRVQATRNSAAHVDLLQLNSRSAALLSLIEPPDGGNGRNYGFTPSDLARAEQQLQASHAKFELERAQGGYLDRFSSRSKHDQPSGSPSGSKRKRTSDEEQHVDTVKRCGSSTDDGHRPFLNALGKITWHYEDADRYLDPGKSDVKRLVVQAADSITNPTPATWHRTSLRADVPLALRMAEWSRDKKISKVNSIVRQAVVALPLQFLISLPGVQAPWEMLDAEPHYYDYPGYHWKWPKHAVNPLDTRAYNCNAVVMPNELSTKQRLIRPRQLIVKQENGKWELDSNPPKNIQYVFISYHWGSFRNQDQKINAMARFICDRENIQAYFQDVRCNAPKSQPGLLSADVNRMSDVIRGSRFVALLLPDDREKSRRNWGERMWTLPEALLAPDKIRVCTWLGREVIRIREMRKVELSHNFWVINDGEDDLDGEEETARNLAEHFDGGITLSRLELFSTAISALSTRKSASDFTGADVAYALMGLLRYRIEPDSSDDLFQVIARLSLTNDNDRMIERLISMFPRSMDSKEKFWNYFSGKDQYETYLWDIEPRCQVVGVGDEKDTVLLSDCRAVPIEWESFPRMMYKCHTARRKTFSELAVRSGAWWIMAAVTLAFTYAPIFLSYDEIEKEFDKVERPDEHEGRATPNFQRWFWETIVIFIGVGAVLAVFAPSAAHNLMGGAIMQPAPHLVAFEGTLPRGKLEKLIFGRDMGRLKYEPSSTPYAREIRHPFVRKCFEPDWIARGEPKAAQPGHRWFTLVDTGNLSISIFQARRPPTVAFITGAEGGMLRAVLCSWRFADDCHYRETVIRVQGNTWERSKTSQWIKVSLRSQEDPVAVGRRTLPGSGSSEDEKGTVMANSRTIETPRTRPPRPPPKTPQMMQAHAHPSVYRRP